jgi:hypothetical protein
MAKSKKATAKVLEPISLMTLQEARESAGNKFPFKVYVLSGVRTLEFNVTGGPEESDSKSWLTDNTIDTPDGVRQFEINAEVASRSIFSLTQPPSAEEKELAQLEADVEALNEVLASTGALARKYGHLLFLENKLGLHEKSLDLSSLKFKVKHQAGSFLSKSDFLITVGAEYSYLDLKEVLTLELIGALRALLKDGKSSYKLGGDRVLEASRHGISCNGFALLTWSEADDVLEFAESERSKSRELKRRSQTATQLSEE